MSFETANTPESNEAAERMRALREYAGAWAEAAEQSNSVQEIMQAGNLLMDKAPDALTGEGKAIALTEHITESTMTRNDGEVMRHLNELRELVDEKGEQPDLSTYEDSVPEYILDAVRKIAYPG